METPEELASRDSELALHIKETGDLESAVEKF